MRRTRVGLSRKAFVLLMVAVLVAAAAYSVDYEATRHASTAGGKCETLGGASRAVTSVANSTTIDAITEYNIAGPSLMPNAISVAPDGSVWFGEESVPGVGHLWPNGTVVSYAWPDSTYRLYEPYCQFKTDIWGIAAWDGMIWATDGDFNGIVGVNPSTGSAAVVNLTGKASFPYTLAVGPDGDLWFTTLSNPAEIGALTPSLQVETYKPSVLTTDEVAGIQFVNSSLAYYVAIDPAEATGSLLSFDPAAVASSFTPNVVGPGFSLISPNSLSAAGDAIWVTQHGSASLASYNESSDSWTTFPTSTESYTEADGTLPYFVQAEGSLVWFNEHYGNKIAILDPAMDSLTEYSESDPPVDNGSLIHDDLTIALAPGGLWFTSLSRNYIGFASSSYVPAFNLSVVGPRTIQLAPGQNGTVELSVSQHGAAAGTLRTEVSDSENATSIPYRISISLTEEGPSSYQAEIKAGQGLPPGRYTLGLTVTDGILYQTAYVFLTVS